jgi:hypothetical protein
VLSPHFGSLRRRMSSSRKGCGTMSSYDIIEVIDAIIDGKKSVSSLTRSEAMAIVEFYEREIDTRRRGGAEALLTAPPEGMRRMMQKLSPLAHCGHSDVERRYKRLAKELGVSPSSSTSGSFGVIVFVIIVLILGLAAVGYFVFF